MIRVWKVQQNRRETDLSFISKPIFGDLKGPALNIAPISNRLKKMHWGEQKRR